MNHDGGILSHEIKDGFILVGCAKPSPALDIEA